MYKLKKVMLFDGCLTSCDDHSMGFHLNSSLLTVFFTDHCIDERTGERLKQ